MSALVEILRIVADNSKVIMVLPSSSDETFVQHSANYFHDSVTEKLYIFTLNPHDELEIFLKRYYKNVNIISTNPTEIIVQNSIINLFL